MLTNYIVYTLIVHRNMQYEYKINVYLIFKRQLFSERSTVVRDYIRLLIFRFKNIEISLTYYMIFEVNKHYLLQNIFRYIHIMK